MSVEFSLRFIKTNQCFFDPLPGRVGGEFRHVGVERTHDPGYGFAVLGGSVEEVKNSRGHDAMEIRVVHLFLVIGLVWLKMRRVSGLSVSIVL